MLPKTLWNPADDDVYWRFKGVGRIVIMFGLFFQLGGGLLYLVGLVWYRAILEGQADPEED